MGLIYLIPQLIQAIIIMVIQVLHQNLQGLVAVQYFVIALIEVDPIQVDLKLVALHLVVLQLAALQHQVADFILDFTKDHRIWVKILVFWGR